MFFFILFWSAYDNLLNIYKKVPFHINMFESFIKCDGIYRVLSMDEMVTSIELEYGRNGYIYRVGVLTKWLHL